MGQWVVDNSKSPPSFMPDGLDTTKMIAITKFGDAFQVYFDPATGITHDGAKYRAEAIAGNRNAALTERRLKQGQ